MAVSLVLVDDDDGLLPEVAGLLLGEDGHGVCVLVFIGVVELCLSFLSGEVVFSSSILFMSLLWDGVAWVWAWAWWGTPLGWVVDGVGVVVCV